MAESESTMLLGRRHKPDHSITMIAGILLLISLVVLYSVSPALILQSGGAETELSFMLRQIGHIGLGIVAFMVAAVMPLLFWRKIDSTLIILAILSTVLILIPGVGLEVNGAKRWIEIGPLNFQPAELVKLALLFYLARFFSEKVRLNKLADRKEVLIPILILLGISGLFIVVLQKDLGTMLAIIALVTAMFFVSGVNAKQLGYYFLSLGGAAVLSIILFPHRMARILTFINADNDVSGASYHINQALIAIGSGGVFGKGLGKSVQVWGYLPEAETDSIFAILAEKFGMIGASAVIILYTTLVVKMFRIVDKTENLYLKFLGIGAASWFASHIVINIGAMLGVIPLTGITLPLMSLGGTSLIVMMFLLGLIFNISRYTKIGRVDYKEGRYEAVSSRRRYGRTRFANFTGN